MYAHQTYDYAKVVTILIQVAILGQYYFYLVHKLMSTYFMVINFKWVLRYIVVMIKQLHAPQFNPNLSGGEGGVILPPVGFPVITQKR